jgi:methylmalonyl-CoA mutase N-terminal domain/subunit
VEAHLRAAAETAARHAATYPKATLFLASGRPVHEAGGSEGWELGFAAAAALAYARAMTEPGSRTLGVDEPGSATRGRGSCWGCRRMWSR